MPDSTHMCIVHHMKLKDEVEEAAPYAEIALPTTKTLDEQEEAAKEVAAEIIEIMRLFARIHGKMTAIRATPETRNNFLRLVKRTYSGLKQDIPHLWRPGLVAEIEAETFE